jgi:hypothetical protein
MGYASVYKKLYPLYTEVCALSQKAKHGSQREKPWGHIVMFIRGACRDSKADYPRLYVCPPEDSIDSPASGVMVSVNSLTSNVNWIATESERFAFFGNLSENEGLTVAQFEKTIQRALDQKIFFGVSIHRDQIKPGSPPEMPLEEVLVRTAVDIDTAVAFGRDVVCARLPMNLPTIQQFVDHLNFVNEQYALKRRAPYQWNAIYNNCAHLVHNSLADLGIWKYKETDQNIIGQVTNLAFPANEMIDLMELANLTDLAEPVKIFRNLGLRKALTDLNWLPMRHGVLSRSISHLQPNELYDGNLQRFIFDFPLSSKNSDLFERFTKDRLFTDPQKNLIHFRGKYLSALNQLQDEKVFLKSLTQKEKQFFPSFFRTYKNYLRMQLDDVEKKLASN